MQLSVQEFIEIQNSSTTSNTLDFLWITSAQQAHRFFV